MSKKQTKIELGQSVMFDKYLERRKKYTDKSDVKYWHRRTMRPEKGIITGLRTISDGNVFYCGDHTNYTPETYHKVAIVTVSLYKKPKLVFLTDLNLEQS